jgi:hypothetical protein
VSVLFLIFFLDACAPSTGFLNEFVSLLQALPVISRNRTARRELIRVVGAAFNGLDDPSVVVAVERRRQTPSAPNTD